MQGVKGQREVWPRDEFTQHAEVKDLLQQCQVVLHGVNDLHLQPPAWDLHTDKHLPAAGVSLTSAIAA